MKKITLSLMLFTLVMSVFGQTSSILFNENFLYPNGTFLTTDPATKNVWKVNTHGDYTPVVENTQVAVGSEKLEYEGYPVDKDAKSILLSASGTIYTKATYKSECVYADIKWDTVSTTWYTSFLVKVDDAKSSGDYVVTFGPSIKDDYTISSGSNLKARVYVKKDTITNTFAIGCMKGNSGAVPVYTEQGYVFGETYLMVIKYKVRQGGTGSNGGGNDSCYVFVNPEIGKPEPEPLLSCPDTAAGDHKIRAFCIRQVIMGNIGTIRVGTNWNEVLSGNITSINKEHVVSGLDVITIGNEIKVRNTKGEKLQSIKVYNLAGQCIRQIKVNTDMDYTFDLQEKGMFVIQVHSNRNVTNKKVIIQ